MHVRVRMFIQWCPMLSFPVCTCAVICQALAIWTASVDPSAEPQPEECTGGALHHIKRLIAASLAADHKL
ncbi:hypothetical protein AAMO2058_001061500 [Amorphochlora amoebiformis]